jgi:hypothetical protein
VFWSLPAVAGFNASALVILSDLDKQWKCSGLLLAPLDRRRRRLQGQPAPAARTAAARTTWQPPVLMAFQPWVWDASLSITKLFKRF